MNNIYKLFEIAEFNPVVSLDNHVEYPFIEMALVDGRKKWVESSVTKARKNGGGAKFDRGDILFARIEPCLDNKKICRVLQKGFGSTEFIVVRAKRDLCCQDFLFYLMKTHYIVQNAINSYSGASGRQRADLNFIKNIDVSLPALPTQKKIASILSNYDNLIENNNRRIAILEEMAEEIYKEWFVRLRFPNWKETKVVDGVPEGWERKKIGEVLNPIKRKKKISTKDYLQEGKFPIIDQGSDLIAGYTNDEDLVQKKPLPIVIFGDHTRRVKFINTPFVSGADGTQLLYPKREDLLPAFFFFAIKNVDLSDYAYARHFKFLKSKEVLIPAGKPLELFNKVVSKKLNQIDLLRNKNQILQKTRDLLLPRLVSGKLSVEHLIASNEAK